jgi:hypothetical protein
MEDGTYVVRTGTATLNQDYVQWDKSISGLKTFNFYNIPSVGVRVPEIFTQLGLVDSSRADLEGFSVTSSHPSNLHAGRNEN